MEMDETALAADVAEIRRVLSYVTTRKNFAMGCIGTRETIDEAKPLAASFKEKLSAEVCDAIDYTSALSNCKKRIGQLRKGVADASC